MSIKRCKVAGKPGFKWGDFGRCFTYQVGNIGGMERAKRQAIAQGRILKVLNKGENDGN